jgi:hypothetical protein
LRVGAHGNAGAERDDRDHQQRLVRDRQLARV